MTSILCGLVDVSVVFHPIEKFSPLFQQNMSRDDEFVDVEGEEDEYMSNYSPAEATRVWNTL